MLVYTPSGLIAQHGLLLLLLLAAWKAGSGQVRYSVPEEAKHGTFVGRIAQDLGLELAELVPRLFRLASKGQGTFWSIHLEVIVDRPLQVFHVEVEVKDINDNAPIFSVSEQKLSIPESRLLDSRFPLEGASDADVGENAVLTYRLSPNEFFILDIINKKDKGKFPVLVLGKMLDREENPQLQLLLTATDGGKPEYTGSVTLLIWLDARAAPNLTSVYEVKMYENSANQTLVIWLNASDADEGINKEMIYSFSALVSPSIRRKFLMNEKTGEIRVNDAIDFEDSNTYEIHVDVTDRGNPPMVSHCTVLVEVLDENDNPPEVVITSLALPVQEDAQVGTVIALISPLQAGVHLQEYYRWVLDSALDRESVANYALVVTARDGGSPSLSATASVSVEVADVNDNAPAFAQPEYTVFVKENNPPGCHIFTVSARDADAQENALVSYSLVERRVGERARSSYVSVHAESGKVYALQPLDHEELELRQFQVSARDAGVPPLGSNVTLQVFVLDENDNAPALLPLPLPLPLCARWTRTRATTRGVVELQRRRGAAQPVPRGAVHGRDQHTRALDEADAPRQRLLVLVKDHGEPALTPRPLCCCRWWRAARRPGRRRGLLVLTLLCPRRCGARRRPARARAGRGTTLVCSSAVGSWSYSQQRRQRVCSGEGPPKADLMAFSPSLPPCPVPDVEMEGESSGGDYSGKLPVKLGISIQVRNIEKDNCGRNLSMALPSYANTSHGQSTVL
ncbi:protocadherin alpha-10-like [Canis lupus familiaris]|uniref:protocadherin alpha-10-like n=1 Tax=Canis lupus familiaris TaxID=9615 RepID=UPI0018F703E1|nr:protocadherin alpha-10-like [Canis lupus familiaris]